MFIPYCLLKISCVSQYSGDPWRIPWGPVFVRPHLAPSVGILYQAKGSKVYLFLYYGESISEWSAHLEQPSISEESIHVDRRERSKVHKETQ